MKSLITALILFVLAGCSIRVPGDAVHVNMIKKAEELCQNNEGLQYIWEASSTDVARYFTVKCNNNSIFQDVKITK